MLSVVLQVVKVQNVQLQLATVLFLHPVNNKNLRFIFVSGSKGNITKRTAWLKERTESALEKSAVVRNDQLN